MAARPCYTSAVGCSNQHPHFRTGSLPSAVQGVPVIPPGLLFFARREAPTRRKPCAPANAIRCLFWGTGNPRPAVDACKAPASPNRHGPAGRLSVALCTGGGAFSQRRAKRRSRHPPPKPPSLLQALLLEPFPFATQGAPTEKALLGRRCRTRGGKACPKPWASSTFSKKFKRFL